MDRNDCVRARYQHCCLHYVLNQNITNQSLRERFHFAESKSAIVSQIIAAAMETGVIKPDEKVGTLPQVRSLPPFLGMRLI